MVDLINGIFDSYYFVLAAALALLVPVWFGSALVDAVTSIRARHRLSAMSREQRERQTRSPSTPKT